ncbi:MAG: UDP-3-O-(3-hydroxymyristoyl)glucosamine N-acyltransferase [SAR86 cluster bacterium]|nr:UDP-3-O-(3-hydroxymyristoyl)glucosamine N-acyltransferase [SAR86 cluster bacterium]
MSEEKNFTLADLAEYTNSKVIGNGDAVVSNLASIKNANSKSITFLSNPKYSNFLETTSAIAVVVHESIVIKEGMNYLQSDDPYAVFAKLSSIFKKQDSDKDLPLIHPSAVISPSSNIGKNVTLGANVVIGHDCIIEDNVIIKSNVSLVQDVHIGENSIIHSNSILGSDGFGYAPSKAGYIKIEQLGKLIIGSNVEIGAGCSIDRGALDNTEIHDGVKLDNQVHIAHNVIIGKDSAIAACCAIAGSSVIGKNFQMGGLSGVLGHLSICDDVIIGAHTLITKNIKKPGNYIGIMPAQNQKDWAKSSIFIKNRG